MGTMYDCGTGIHIALIIVITLLFLIAIIFLIEKKCHFIRYLRWKQNLRRVLAIEPSQFQITKDEYLDRLSTISKMVIMVNKRTTGYLAYSLIVPRVILGDRETAANLDELKSLGVTHVLDCTCSDIKASQRLFHSAGMQFKGLPIEDCEEVNLLPFLDEASRFIAQGRKRGSVFIFCATGCNVSPVITMAYLMLHQNFTVELAVRSVLVRPFVQLHFNFQLQLIQLQVALDSTN